MGILYQSTRGQAPELDFRSMTLAGLATDGGLYVPKTWPEFSQDSIAAMKGKPYAEVAEQVLRPFIVPALPDADLRRLLKERLCRFPRSCCRTIKATR